jgi:hypothetical protein
VLPAGRQWPWQVRRLHGVFRVLQARAYLTDIDRDILVFSNIPSWRIVGEKILNAPYFTAKERGVNQISHTLPADLVVVVEQVLDDWETGSKVSRLWSLGVSLWTR